MKQKIFLDASLQVKFESVPLKTRQEINQDSLIRHLQNRISNLREDNMRLRDNQQSTSILSSFHDVRSSIDCKYFLFDSSLKIFFQF